MEGRICFHLLLQIQICLFLIFAPASTSRFNLSVKSTFPPKIPSMFVSCCLRLSATVKTTFQIPYRLGQKGLCIEVIIRSIITQSYHRKNILGEAIFCRNRRDSSFSSNIINPLINNKVRLVHIDIITKNSFSSSISIIARSKNTLADIWARSKKLFGFLGPSLRLGTLVDF